MNTWDENSGYYCLMIAIFCNLDATEAWLMYIYGPSHPICRKFLNRKVKISSVDKMTKKETGSRMRELRQLGHTFDEIADAFNCCPSTVKKRIRKAEEVEAG